MQRISLNRSPDDNLFCPFCGTQTIEAGEEAINECPHLVYSNMDEDPEGSAEYKKSETDICFVLFESAPASREHFFIFRED